MRRMGRPSLGIGEYGTISIYGRKSAWTAQARYRDTDGVTRKVRAMHRIKFEAERALREKLEGRQAAGAGLSASTPLAGLLAYWLERKKANQSTLDKYKDTIDRLILPARGKVPIRDITVSSLESLLEDVESVTNRAHVRTILAQAFDIAVRVDALDSNPARSTTPVTRGKAAVVEYTPERIAAFRRHVAAWGATRYGSRLWANFIQVMIGTGARPGEILALRWDETDLKAGTIKISGTVERDSVNGLHRQEYTKTKLTELSLKLPGFAVEALRDQWDAAKTDSPYVFHSRSGGLIEPANAKRGLGNARSTKLDTDDDTGFEDLTYRSFRKAAATLLSRQGGSMDAAAQLGHVDDTVTKKHYIAKELKVIDNSSALEVLG